MNDHVVYTSCIQNIYASFWAKFDCPIARQNLSLLATAHDFETAGLSEHNTHIQNSTVCYLLLVVTWLQSTPPSAGAACDVVQQLALCSSPIPRRKMSE